MAVEVIYPEAAIRNEDDLKVIIVLGLSIEVWDLDMNTIRTRYPIGIGPGITGKIIHFKNGIGQYLKWYGFSDPTYKMAQVILSSEDKDFEKALSYTASIYMFNNREEAVVAQAAYTAYLKAKRNK